MSQSFEMLPLESYIDGVNLFLAASILLPMNEIKIVKRMAVKAKMIMRLPNPWSERSWLSPEELKNAGKERKFLSRPGFAQDI